jgi:hypothetical protein
LVKAPATLTVASLLLFLFVIQGVAFLRANSETYDEPMHLAAGYSYLAKRDFRLEPQNPPLIKELLALPLFLAYGIPFSPDAQYWRDGIDHFVGQDFLYRSALPAERMLALSRAPNLFLGGLLVALTGWWAYRLWGAGAAILALALACFEPNLVAHSALVTTDIGVTLFIFLSIYLLWEYLQAPRWWLLAALGISSGLALASKFSAILLAPMIVLIMAQDAFVAARNDAALPPGKHRRQLGYQLMKRATLLLPIFFLAAITISAAYFFQGFHLWLVGLRRFLSLAQVGQPAFFLGEYSYQGWWNYFLVAFLIKTPIGSLILIAASLPFYHADSRRRAALFLLLPVAIVFLATIPAKVNIGLRHVLPVYPFLFVLASRLATVRLERRWLARFLIGAPLVFTVISSLRITPHQLAYFNEMVGGPDQGYRYLGDSNLDWGQDLKGLKSYLAKEKLPIVYLSYFGSAPPSYYGIRYQFVPGSWPLQWPPPADRVPETAQRRILAISATNLQDTFNSYDPLFPWLRARQPLVKIGYSIFIYDLTNDPEGLLKLRETYFEAGLGAPGDARIYGLRENMRSAGDYFDGHNDPTINSGKVGTLGKLAS